MPNNKKYSSTAEPSVSTGKHGAIIFQLLSACTEVMYFLVLSANVQHVRLSSFIMAGWS